MCQKGTAVETINETKCRYSQTKPGGVTIENPEIKKKAPAWPELSFCSKLNNTFGWTKMSNTVHMCAIAWSAV